MITWLSQAIFLVSNSYSLTNWRGNLAVNIAVDIDSEDIGHNN